jgi:hypothetical protein
MTFFVPAGTAASTAGAHDLVVSAGGWTAPAVTFTVTPALASVPSAAPAGTTVALTGSGFGAGSAVQSVTFDGAPLAVSPGVPTTTAAGTFSATFTVPSAIGTHTLAVTDAEGNTATRAFEITAAVAASLVITSAPLSGAASATASLGPMTFALRDAGGNPVAAPAGGTVVTLSSNSAGSAVFAATAGGAGTTTVTIPAGAAGVAVYYGDTAAGTPTVTAAASGLAPATQQMTISANVAAKLVFGQQPTTTAQNATITPAVTARVLDQYNNPTAAGTQVTIAIANDASLLGNAVLYGTKTRTAFGGVATFDGLSISGLLGALATGNGFTLRITANGLTPAVSSPFNIT